MECSTSRISLTATVQVRRTTNQSVAYSSFVRYGNCEFVLWSGGDFRTEDKTCATSAAMRRDPVADRCSPSEVAFAPLITLAKYRFGISETRYFVANRR